MVKLRRPAQDTQDEQNYDSFLDIVANLVGILVILITVIGVRAQNAWQSTNSSSTAPPPVQIVELPDAPPSAEYQSKIKMMEELVSAVKTAESQSLGLNQDVHEMDSTIREIELLAEVQQQERNEMQLLVSLAEKALEERRKRLAESDQIALAVTKKLDEGRVELARLEQQIESAEKETGEPEILEHRPTPIAKTVFGTEEHFRLINGQLAYVPINQMTAMLRRDAENKLWKLGSIDQVTETIGPIDGFRMKYTLERRERRVNTPDGPRVRKLVELQRFVMVPESIALGESIPQALSAGSDLSRRLAGMRPDETTITVWTYPDSYAEFRQLKLFLFERGFLAAARPLPDGFPIGGSPEGTKSAAE